MKRFLLIPIFLWALTIALNVFATEEEEEDPNFGGTLAARSKLTGDWGGVRNQWAKKGFTTDLDVVYTLQGVAAGGYDGPLFPWLSEEDEVGNTVSTEASVGLDTGKLGLYPGGFWQLNAELRAGRSVVERAGTIAVVNNDAIFPNDSEDFDDAVVALTTLSYSQEIAYGLSLFGGLLNTSEGDANAISGSALSHEHFLNTGLLYALVEDATVPNVSLGGGLGFEPNDYFSGSFSVFGSEETAGKNPFKRWEGVTFSTEGTVNYELFKRAGAQTFGLLYGIDKPRTNIAVDRRTVLASLLRGTTIPPTESDTWAFYYNGHHVIQGDNETGWGPFWRFGISDANPNPVHWHVAGGLAGSAAFLGRPQDRWGGGVYYLNLSDEDLLRMVRVDDEIGGEIFYNFALFQWLHFTVDGQLIDGGLPRSETAWVFGLRTGISL